jgi:hypothetical protein
MSMSSLLCSLLLFGLVPLAPVVEDRADVIEVNRYYDQDGRQVFVQVIFWDWRAGEGAYRVFAWRMLKTAEQIPVYDWWRGCYVTQFLDQNVLRSVRAAGARDTWTQYDPELDDRQFLPQHARRGLADDGPRREPQP